MKRCAFCKQEMTLLDLSEHYDNLKECVGL